jgi:hypothetical protein
MIKYTNNEFDWYKELKVMSNVMKNTKKKRFLLCSISFLMTFVCIFILYACLKVVPFGEKTLAWADADIQYLDFFSYFRDVLLGKNSIKYSMSNTLGNTSIGVYSYYLASPLNVLVLFFKQSQLLEFFSLLMAMKLSIASVTACYYLQVRFKDQIHPIVTCLLACAYGMMQYNMAQGSNIMWIDGVYMLPLIMLGVYKLVNTKRITALTIPVALSILFNWYTAGINCLWSGIILLIELALYVCREKVKIKDVLLVVVRYMVAMMIALCISAVLFLPSVMDLRNGRGSKFDWRLLTSTLNLYEAGVFTLAYASANLFLNIGKYGMRNFQVSDVKRQFNFKEYNTSRIITTQQSVCTARLQWNFSQKYSGNPFLPDTLFLFCGRTAYHRTDKRNVRWILLSTALQQWHTSH